MSMTTAHNRVPSPVRGVPPEQSRSGSLGRMDGWVVAPWAVGVGDMLALPILETIEGLSVDLEAIAAHRALVLVYDPSPADAGRAGALTRYAKARCLIEAAGAALVLVTPNHPGRLYANEETDGVQVALDTNDRFAHTLGLLGPTGERPVAATYVVDEAGTVIWSEIETDWASRPGLSGLMPLLKALKPAATRT